MTEFEKQVTEAVCETPYARGSSAADLQACARCEKLGPKIAGALVLIWASAGQMEPMSTEMRERVLHWLRA